MHYKNIETAAFKAWPAREQHEGDTLVMRFADGYTKRANSATVLNALNTDSASLRRSCEQFYQQKKLPCIIRITSLSQAQELDLHLGDSGYEHRDRSLILDRALNCQQPQPQSQQHSGLVLVQPQQWLQSFCELSGSDYQEHLAHLAILERIDQPLLLAQWQVQGRVVACAVGVISNGYFGIFDLLTDPAARNCGYATLLLTAMTHRAIKRGATHSYLQVVAVNTAAINLYQKLGYCQSYEYWYRIKEIS
ncbi:MAG: hypothetical protein OFPI_14680 [Osedax symbiont Rs2]|nr:MAG: hypothetical protein OFPI_14680 [Osedax symbiont Rs2]